MPIARWICQGCGGREVPLSHFAESACGDTVVHPDFAAAILADRDSQYVTGKVRVSHGLGCPRRAAIEESEPWAADPLDINPMITGTAWHALMENKQVITRPIWKGCDPFIQDQHATVCVPVSAKVAEDIETIVKRRELCEVELSGTVAGVQVAGKTDRIRRLSTGELAIEDWKHVNDFNVKYLKDGPKPEHKVQASIYAELCEQGGRERPTVGIIWYHSSQSGKAALTPHKFDLMPIAEATEVRPYDCDYTVRELLRQMDKFYGGDVSWKRMPLAGKSIKFGAKTGCDYCAVRSICWIADKSAPF